MPRASYGDRYTITVMHGDSHVVLDFTSKVVDFIVLCNAARHSETVVAGGLALFYSDFPKVFDVLYFGFSQFCGLLQKFRQNNCYIVMLSDEFVGHRIFAILSCLVH